MRNLLGKEILFFDGGMGTLLQEKFRKHGISYIQRKSGKYTKNTCLQAAIL